jgi:hypothetical protein
MGVKRRIQLVVYILHMKRPVMKLVWLIVAVMVQAAESKRILVYTSPAASHFLESTVVSEVLVARGHEVFALVPSGFPQGLELLAPGVTPLVYHTGPEVKSVAQLVAENVEENEAVPVSRGLLQFCRSALEDQAIRGKITELEFDLALVDGFQFTYCTFLLPYLHGIPAVMMFSSIHPWLSGTPSLPSFCPIGHHQGDLQFSDAMSFAERIENLFWFVIMFRFYNRPGRTDISLLQEYAPELNDWDTLVKKSVLFVQTRDYMLDYPSPNLPNFITTPGVTPKPAKPLTGDLKSVLDRSDGAIFMSFGSISSGFPPAILNNLVGAVNQFDMTIIWALRRDSVDYVKDKIRQNIYIFNWVPQNDVLGHNNTRLFITHCGNNGQYEALYHGVPMVGIPMFGEQPHNAFRIQDHGYGVSLLPKTMLTFSTENLVAAILEVSTNPVYRENAKRASAILKDRPLPAETIADWIEHVMRHGSAHLRSRGMELTWYQFWMLDILVFVSVVVVVFIATLFCLVRCCVTAGTGQKGKKD